MRIIDGKRPLFFVAENVPGILSSRHYPEFENILHELKNMGYNIWYGLVNANDYGVPQTRKRVFIVGYRKSTGEKFEMP